MATKLMHSEPAPPEPYRLQSATMDDVDAATEFFNICEIDESGVPDYEVEEVREEWAETDLSRDLVLVLTPDGQIVASMNVKPQGSGIFDAYGYTHPEHRGRGLGKYLITWSELRALEDEVGADTPAERLVRNWVATRNLLAAEALGVAGYQQVKRFVRMEIALETEPELSALPDGIEFREVELERDLTGLFKVVDESFSEHWSGAPRTFEEWKKTALGFGHDPSLWTQAHRDGERIGVAVGQNLAGYGWIKWVGVLKSERGKGLGMALLRQQFVNFWRIGARTIGLGVDSENTTGAQELYLNAGMKLTQSYDAYEKQLTRQN